MGKITESANYFTFCEELGDKLSYQHSVSKFFKGPFVLGYSFGAAERTNDVQQKNRSIVFTNFEVALTEAAAKINYNVAKRNSGCQFAYRFTFFDALRLAHVNHYRVMQTRKWEYNNIGFDIDYIFHPVAVALKLFDLLKDRQDLPHEDLDTLMCAAVLHDVVEDTIAPEYYEQAYASMHCFYEKNPYIPQLVRGLTNVPSVKSYELSDRPIPEGITLYNRNQRKIIDIERLRVAPIGVQVIKLVDIWHNTETMHLLDCRFVETYKKEIAQVFSVLTKPNDDPIFAIVYDTTKETLQEHGIAVNHLP